MMIELGSDRVTLLPERAVWLTDSRSLLVADLHLGKAQSFRRAGIPVPAGTTAATLGRLGTLIERHAPAELIVLGDFLHGPLAQQGPAIDALALWRARYPRLPIRMVRGNHDDAAGDPPKRCGIECLTAPLARAAFALCHDPDEPADRFKLAGHVHPVISLRGAIDRARLGCFWLRRDALVLPAFGDFTGGWEVRAKSGERTFAIADGQVFDVGTLAARPRARSRWRAGEA